MPFVVLFVNFSTPKLKFSILSSDCDPCILYPSKTEFIIVFSNVPHEPHRAKLKTTEPTAYLDNFISDSWSNNRNTHCTLNIAIHFCARY